MTNPTQDSQGRNFDVEQDPDGFSITFRFYGWVALIGLALAALWSVWP